MMAGGRGMGSQIEQLRGLAHNIAHFWQLITGALLLLATAITFTQAPALLARPRGWAIALLTVALGAWYTLGLRWMTGGDPPGYWRRLMRRPGVPYSARGLVFWAVLLGLTCLLSALGGEAYRLMLWPAYGISFMLAPMPAMLLYLVPNMLVLFAAYGWLPRAGGVEEWLSFGLNIVLFAIYTAVAYIPYLLLKSRFERERVYAELAQSHRELAEAHRQLEERAAQDREIAIWRERARLARELHDTLGHSLALMAVKLDAAQRLRAVDAARADHEIEATQGIARAALAELRAAIANVRAPALERAPLGEVLARRARELAGTAGWQVTYDIAPELGALDDAAYEALLRIGCEALANVERHARARSVRLSLRRADAEVVLRIEDDGRGILTTNPATEL
ncbi:MAG TPA: histidine kinase, partial [Ktedonobacterales bacterium]